MLSVAVVIVTVVVGLVVLDRLIMRVLPMIAPLLPREFCGPDGWLMDTHRASGIFDRRTR